MMSSVEPNENDVLLGRGGNNHKWHGNKQLRNLAFDRVEEYGSAKKAQKKIISRGRFLEMNKETNSYYEVTEEKAREKVCQELRDAVATEKIAYPLKL